MSAQPLNFNLPIPQPNKLNYTKYSKLSKGLIIQKYPSAAESFKSSTPIVSKEEKIDYDDGEKARTWSEAYRSAGYYYDTPSISERFKFLEEFKFNFSAILSQTENPHEIPDLRNRRSLLLWVCKQHNSFLKLKNSENSVDCNADYLVKAYFPSQQKAKEFLGAQDFFI